MKRCLLSGGTGFIGSALSKKLICSEMDVTLLVRDVRRVSDEVKRIATIVQYDPPHASEVEMEEGFDCFYHLAWGGGGSDKKMI